MDRNRLGKESSYLKSLLNSREEGAISIFGSKDDFFELIKDMEFDIFDLDNNVSVAKVREVINECMKSSHKKKMVVIDKAHLVSPEVYNTALKSVEEPIGTFYIFISTASLPSTIKSRLIEINLSNKDEKMSHDSSITFGTKDLEQNTEYVLEWLLEYSLRKNRQILEKILVIKGYFKLGIKVDSILMAILHKEGFLKLID